MSKFIPKAAILGMRQKSALPFCLLFFCLALTACGGGGGGGGTATPLAPTGFTVSGGIVATNGTVADSDVNDTNAPFISNDQLTSPQDIPNPVNVGGYVNQPGQGATGRSFLVGDASDVYKISAAAGQRITLIIGDNSIPNDLDLFLGDTNGNLIASSEGVGIVEEIITPSAGTFLIEVFAFDGASNYVLLAGQNVLSASDTTLSVMNDFVPGEVVVRFQDVDGKTLRGLATLSSKASTFGLTSKAGALGREALLSLGDVAQKRNAIEMLKLAEPKKRQPALLQVTKIDPIKIETIRTIKALRRRADIKYATPNHIYKPSLLPNDEYYPLQWHYPMLNLPQAWDISTGSNNVIVAVIDTGVILAHPDLQGRLIQGYDFIQDPLKSRDGDGIDSDPDDPGDLSRINSSSFHGTHVAGTIGASTNNGTGVSGVTWATSIMPLRALGFSGGTSYDIAQAVRYAAGLSNDSGTLPAKRADVINMSLGGPGFSQADQDLLTQVRNQGVIVVAAAGNNDTNVPVYPASYAGVVSVSAVDINKAKASYSSFGASVDIAAPGGDFATADLNGDGAPDAVLSTQGDDSLGAVLPIYQFSQGTSMASPHVAGVVALMKSVNPVLTPASFDALLASGALTVDLGATGRDDVYGHGLIDAHKAVVAAGAVPVTAVLVANPSSLNFGTVDTSLSFFLENAGGSVLTVSAVNDNAPWLSVTESTVDANKNGVYTATANRAGLSVGFYTGTITATSSANTVSIPVIMEVRSAAASANAGFQHVLLIDAATFETVAAVTAGATNGRYSYSFSSVPSGTYGIVSGSDSNNDSFICDAGESCGAYPALDKISVITVDSNTSLNDFQTAYLTPFFATATEAGDSHDRAFSRVRNNATPRQIQR